MPLILHKSTITDLSAITSLQFAAFQQSSPIDLASAMAFREKPFHEPENYYLKVVDSDLGSEIGHAQPAECDEEHAGGSSSEATNLEAYSIAFARYFVWNEHREAAKWDLPYTVQEGELGSAEEVNLEAARLLSGKIRELTRNFVRGRKCVCKLIYSKSHI